MFCAGYPSSEEPSKGIFTHRTAVELSKLFHVEVVLFSAFTLKRRFKSRTKYQGIPLVKIAVPQVPHYNKPFLILLNNWLLHFFGRLILGGNYLKQWDYYHYTMLIPTSIAVSSWAVQFGKRHIGQAIGDDINIFLPRLKQSKRLRHLLDQISLIQFNSKALRHSFFSQVSFPEERTFVLYRGVDLSLFKPAAKEKQESPPTFLFLGGVQTFEPEQFNSLNTKGAHILLEAWELYERDNAGRLIFGGPGIIPEKLEGWKKSLRFPERVTLLTEPVAPDDVSTLIRDSDVVLIPSLNEGLPNLANEAQACGIPVIGTDAGGIPETVIHENTGLLVPKKDPTSLAGAMQQLSADRRKRIMLGNNGRLHMERHFSWENFVLTIREHYIENEKSSAYQHHAPPQ